MTTKARIRRPSRGGDHYCALDAAQEILDDATASGLFEGCDGREISVLASTILGREFDDVEARIEEGRLVARTGLSYWRPGNKTTAAWLPEEAT